MEKQLSSNALSAASGKGRDLLGDLRRDQTTRDEKDGDSPTVNYSN
jgi:hypothetical protein